MFQVSFYQGFFNVGISENTAILSEKNMFFELIHNMFLLNSEILRH